MADSTVLKLEGRDVLDLLHRVTTNRLDDLATGAARGTLFCDFRGRLLHRAVVARLGDTIWLLRDDAPAAPLLAHLDRQIFREDVRVTDSSGTLAVWSDMGVSVSEGSVDGDDAPRIVRAPGDVPLRVGAAVDAPPASIDAARARVRSGRPIHGHEIVDAFTPFEVNLAHEVHLDKGCYTGQETLQRLVTYDSVRRRLAWVGGAGAPPETPLDLEREGNRVGRLTSAMADGAAWIGLAVTAWDLADPADVTAGGGSLERLEAVPLRRPIGRAWAVAG